MLTGIKISFARVHHSMITNKKKVLLIRLDKIGDLICTLPASQILDSNTYEVTWVIQKGMSSILQYSTEKYHFIELDKSKPDHSQKEFSDFLNQNHFDIAVSFQCPWWINFELFKNKIPKRIGVYSQWHSFLFLNQGLRQKRSKALKHEFEYNLDLVQLITGPIQKPAEQFTFQFKRPTSSALLEKYNLNKYIVVHPGMMGSALNWPQEKYIDFIQTMIDQNKTIVITGTAADENYLSLIKTKYHKHASVVWLQSILSFSELLEIIFYSEYVVAPSTGVIHIAASLGKKIYGIYSPILVHRPVRWKPRPISISQDIQILAPNVNCPARKTCLGPKCTFYNCMQTIDLKSIV